MPEATDPGHASERRRPGLAGASTDPGALCALAPILNLSDRDLWQVQLLGRE